MSYVIIEQSPIVSAYVAKKVGVKVEKFGEHYSLGVANNTRPVAGVVFNCFRNGEFGNDVSVTIAGETRIPWARPAVLRALFGYPFLAWDCARITAIIKEGNEPSISFCKSLGFRKEGVVRRGWDGKTNALVFGLLKHECRYVNG